MNTYFTSSSLQHHLTSFIPINMKIKACHSPYLTSPPWLWSSSRQYPSDPSTYCLAYCEQQWHSSFKTTITSLPTRVSSTTSSSHDITFTSSASNHLTLQQSCRRLRKRFRKSWTVLDVLVGHQLSTASCHSHTFKPTSLPMNINAALSQLQSQQPLLSAAVMQAASAQVKLDCCRKASAIKAPTQPFSSHQPQPIAYVTQAHEHLTSLLFSSLGGGFARSSGQTGLSE
jgi:hypothetical protein